MSDTDRQKWQERYLNGAYEDRLHPSVYLEACIGDLNLPARRALDLACGAGRNALYLARNGFHVDAVDVAPEALRRAQLAADKADMTTIRWIEHDFDYPLPEILTDYGLILMVRYLNLDLLRAVTRKLLPGGYMLAEVHLRTEESVAGPSSDRYRAEAGELKAAAEAAGLAIQEYSEGLSVDPDGEPVALARLLASYPGTP